ncbi:FtsX-like permease family protein [Agromyces sp. LHK192]|uniref:FtsX-like permease family protein n=1 Tax=Agromyces sp. LHK192 TaxID=2498704 RepID=UPI0013E3F3E7|nr:FtsX-like permease family protein [Agromyces sp. LHK192]
MGTGRMRAARARARIGVLAGMAATVLVAAALAGGLSDLMTTAPAAGVSDALDRARGEAGAMRWTTRLEADAEAQRAAAAPVLDRMLASRGAEWQRSVASDPVVVDRPDRPLAPMADGEAPAVVLLADPDAAHASTLVAGTWPDDPGAADLAGANDASPAALQADAADALGVEPGDVLVIPDGGARVVVTGTWRPDDPGDPRWFGDALAAAGRLDAASGPLLVDEPVVAGLPTAVRVRWTATVPAATATARQLAAVAAVLPNVEPALRADPAIGDTGVSTHGALAETVGRVVAADRAAGALAPVPLAVVGVSAAIALWRLATLLAEARRRETALLRSRGASVRWIVGSAAAEAAVIAVPAAAVGLLAAEGVLALARPAEPRSWLLAGSAAAVCAVAAVVIVAVVAWAEARRPLVRGAGDDSGRSSLLAATGAVALVALVASVAVGRFLLDGGPLVAGEPDGLSVLAPVLVLVAPALAALLLAAPVGRLLERAAALRRGLVPALPMRQLARRSPLYASSALVTVVAVGGLTLASALSGTWAGFEQRAAVAREGADVRVILSGRGVVAGADALALDDPFSIDGVSASGPVFTGEVRLGSDPAQLVALPAAQVDRLAPGARGLDDVAGLTAPDGAPPVAPAGIPVEGGATLSAEVRADAPAGTPGTVAARAWVTGPAGAAVAIPLGSVPVGAAADLTADLPPIDGLALLGVEFELDGARGLGDPRAVLGGIRVGDRPVELSGETVLSSTQPTGRVVAESAAVALPVIVTGRLASEIDAARGDPLAFRILVGGAAVDATVAGFAPTLPGGGDLLADLGGLQAAAFADGAGVPAYDERWLAADDPERVAADLVRAQPVALAVHTAATASAAAVVGSVIDALWIGAAGAAVFALIALGALASALAAGRTGETAVLRALGVGAGTQGRARFAELAWLLAAAVPVGIGVGVLAGVTTVPGLVRAAVPGAPAALPVELAAQWLPWAVALAILAGLALAIAAVAGARTAARGRTATTIGDEG